MDDLLASRKGDDMVTPTRLARAIGIFGVIGFLALATTAPSIATQTPLQDPDLSPVFAPFDDEDDPLPPPQPVTEPVLVSEPATPSASAVDEAPVPQRPEPLKELPAEDAKSEEFYEKALPRPRSNSSESLTDPAEDFDNPLPPAREPARSTAQPRAITEADLSDGDTNKDPDTNARLFLERNRKEAEGQLKSLRSEAEQLRARLARVEAGIRRWEALADALDRTENRNSEAAMREPIRQTSRRFEGNVQYIVPSRVPGVVIQSQPVTRADYVPAPQPR